MQYVLSKILEVVSEVCMHTYCKLTFKTKAVFFNDRYICAILYLFHAYRNFHSLPTLLQFVFKMCLNLPNFYFSLYEKKIGHYQIYFLCQYFSCAILNLF